MLKYWCSSLWSLLSLLSKGRTWIAFTLLCAALLTFHELTRVSDVTDYNHPGTWIPFTDSNFRAESQGYPSVKECRENFEQRNKSRQWFWSPSYKNPCWRGEKGLLGCVPYFFVLGFPKCGTTDLFNRIKLHPGYVPPLFKEIHWITRYRFFPLGRNAKGKRIIQHVRDLHKGFRMYLRVFSPLTEILKWCYDPYNSNTTTTTTVVTSGASPYMSCEDRITGDFSPSTIWDSDLYTQLPENKDRMVPVHTPGDFVHDMNPCAKLIIMLRNPVNRLYSDYLHFYKHKSPQQFHEIVTSTIDLYKRCFRKWGIRPCVHQYYLEVTGKARLRLGIYYIYISDWLEKFPRDQFLFIRLEDYAVDTKHHLQNIFKYLDLPPISDGLLNEMSSAAPTNTRQDRKEDSDAPPMLPETRLTLDQFYAPFNKKLAMLLNDKRYEW
ncbi:carbohydrate sulfotransferase 15-like [Mizuhopecten yessoensis]|uniref:Carbohydrate sulfotransferase 15 n=1 Tax=Mizuhopecten yessoensis TaxID=6573 RepID=A0A210QWR9_MIZYE|nr:carbohydrate sulfotransferase 15-like [Mizuhopecten yessoensis]OWF53146.1 Carbohydrate sulfotransferase 15 [Mizuhopecten yessoensis]